MTETDLHNLQNILTIADCNNEEPFIAKDIQEFARFNYNDIECIVYLQKKTTAIITFSPFDFKDYRSLKTGFQLIFYQNIQNMGNVGMNSFFNTVSSYFCEKVKFPPDVTKLYITGISMGGAIGQCFYYHFVQNHKMPTKIFSFGSPRVGDKNLHDWFEKNVDIKNYVLVKNNKIDPVCLFPSGGEYINNANLKTIGRISKISQPDTEITFKSLLYNFGLERSVSELWDEIHNISEYYESLRDEK